MARLINWIVIIFMLLVSLIALLFLILAAVPKFFQIFTAFIDMCLNLISMGCMALAIGIITWIGKTIHSPQILESADKLRRQFL